LVKAVGRTIELDIIAKTGSGFRSEITFTIGDRKCANLAYHCEQASIATKKRGKCINAF
jgi:hypothetical protein